MKKIGILTFYYNNINYGGLLQAFALQKYLTFLGFDAEQICYDFQSYRKKNIKDYVYLFKNRIIKSKSKNINETYFSNSTKRYKKFKQFEESIPHSKRVYNYRNIRTIKNNYDFFICGSDQIWNDWGLKDKVIRNFALDFVESENKMSYAASFGTSVVSKSHSDLLKNHILDLSHVTVREENGLDILREMGRLDGRVVVDPVFLLSKKEWSVIAEDPKGLPDNYVCMYFLGDLKDRSSSIYDFFRKNNINTVLFPHINHYKSGEDIHSGFNCYGSPTEFIGAIKKAKLVLTDSFHAMVFSLIFNKEFYVIERDTLIKGNNMSSRITSLLRQVNLSERLIGVEDLNKIDLYRPIEYEKVNDKLNDIINESKRILSSCLII